MGGLVCLQGTHLSDWLQQTQFQPIRLLGHYAQWTRLSEWLYRTQHTQSQPIRFLDLCAATLVDVAIQWWKWQNVRKVHTLT